MKIRALSKLRRSRGNRQGAALVIILAFLVLLSGVVLAFFARAMSERQASNSSANQTKAEILAQGALDQIIGDLKQEIADGSTVATIGGTTIYTPVAATNMVPQLAGSSGTGGLKTLVKRSAFGIPFSANGSQRAANASTLSKSQNGRFITPARWNKPLLLPKSDQSTNNDVDWTPLGATASGWASAPDWIYVARDGSNPTSWNANLISTGTNPTAVVGRFAYMIYDVGGLLDMNAAGYPSKATTTQAGGKTGIAYADLTQLTDSTGAQLLSNPQIDNLVGWRNFASASTDWTKTPLVLSSSVLSGYPGSGTAGWTAASATNYYNFTLKNKKSYLSTENPLLNNGQSDRLFTSRQELMRFLLGNIASQAATPVGKAERAKAQNALQYLGTFTRAVTTPSWSPATPSGSSIPYAALADDPSAINRNFAKMRHTSSATVTHYKDDGTAETPLNVGPGDPLLSRRFSLAKLAWLGHDGPNAAAFAPTLTATQQNEAIKACFGLTFTGKGSRSARWDYNHGDPNKIMNLDEVRQAGREPDFFELLKAGILTGSLGGQPGTVGGVDTSTAGPAGLAFNYYSGEKDRHILQIGANIIDQADADNYPTAIYMPIVSGKYSVPYGEQELFDTVFGTENLPVLQRMSAVSYAMNIGNGTASNPWKPGTEDVWLQPEVWNPNDSSTADIVKYPDTPGHLRLVTYGGCQVKTLQTDAQASHAKTKELPYDWIADFGNNPSAPDPVGIVAFVNPKPGSTKPNDLFTSPVALESTGNTTPSANNYFDPIVTSGPNNYMYYSNPGAGTRLMGVWLGKFDRDPRDWTLGGYPTHSVSMLPINNTGGEPQMTFVLEYNDKPNGTGTWLPYSMMARVQEIRSASSFTYNHRDGWISWWLYWGAGRPDPRTDRFSSHSGNINSSGTTYTYAWSAGDSIRPTAILKSAQGGGKGCVSFYMPDPSLGFFYRNPVNAAGLPGGSFAVGYLLDDWAWNLAVPNDTYAHFWYADPDGVVRPGDAWRADYGVRPAGGVEDRSSADAVCGDGVSLYNTDQLTASKNRRRPVILNRPFRSVGELGYVYRDQPFKSLDFYSDKSADAGLLDLFSVRDEQEIVAGRVNPNNAQIPVLQAIISGSIESDTATTVVLPSSEAAIAAQAIANDLSTNGLLINPAELVSRISPAAYTALSGIAANNTATNKPLANKTYGESTLRALSSVPNTRTWNLMIDVIGQSGQFTPNAKTLGDFVVQGERRYWLHIAIDRLTGKVVDQQLESVYE